MTYKQKSFDFCICVICCHFQALTTPSIFQFGNFWQCDSCRLFSCYNNNLTVADTSLTMFEDMELSQNHFIRRSVISMNLT